MFMGCSQPGSNMMGNVNSKRPIKKSTLKKAYFEIKSKVTNDDIKVIVSYTIDENDQLHLDRLFNPTTRSGFDPGIWTRESTNLGKHQGYFNWFAKMIPKEFRKEIKSFHIFYQEKEANEKNPIVAGIKFGREIWQNNNLFLKIPPSLGLAYDLERYNDKPYYSFLEYPYICSAMLHEFGHYLALGGHQPDLLLRYLGLSLKKIDPIVQKFKCMSESNAGRKKAYVSRYAVTSWEEDFAETFVYFVLLQYPPKLDASTSIAMKKVLLFCNDTKMVEIKKAIRANLEKLNIRPNMPPDDLKQLFIKLQTPNAN